MEKMKSEAMTVPLDRLIPNPSNFFSVSAQSLGELAESIKEVGMLHPLLVVSDNGKGTHFAHGKGDHPRLGVA